jgi:hypothetical protein
VHAVLWTYLGWRRFSREISYVLSTTIAPNRAINDHGVFNGVPLSQCDVKYYPLE